MNPHCVNKAVCMAIAAMLVMSAFIARAAEPIQLTGQTAWGKDAPIFTTAARRFAKNVKTFTNGRVKLKMHGAGEVVPSFDILEAVNKGVLDVGCAWTGFWKDKFLAAPLFSEGLAAGAGVFDPMQWYSWMYFGGGRGLLEEMYSEQNLVPIHHYAILPPENLAWSNKPIRELADWKGLQYRTVGYWEAALNRIGATVLILPPDQIFPSLQKGILDAAEFSASLVDRQAGMYKAAKYLVTPGVHQPCVPCETLFNKSAWNRLSQQDRILVNLAAKESFLWSLGHGMKAEAEALAFFREQGIEVITLSPAELKKIIAHGEKLVDEYAEKDPFVAKVVRSRREFDKAYSDYARPVLGTLMEIK